MATRLRQGLVAPGLVMLAAGCMGVDDPPRKWDVSRQEAAADNADDLNAGSVSAEAKENLNLFCENKDKNQIVVSKMAALVARMCQGNQASNEALKLIAAGPIAAAKIEEVIKGGGEDVRAGIPVLSLDVQDDKANKLTKAQLGGGVQLAFPITKVIKSLTDYVDRPGEIKQVVGQFADPSTTEQVGSKVSSSDSGFIAGYESTLTNINEKPIRIESVYSVEKTYFKLVEDKVYLALESYKTFTKGSIKKKNVLTVFFASSDTTSNLVSMAELELDNKGFHSEATKKLKPGFRNALIPSYVFITKVTK